MNREERRALDKLEKKYGSLPSPKAKPPTIFVGYVRPRFPGMVYARFSDSLWALAAASSGLYGMRPIAMESGPLLSRARNNLLRYFLDETDDEYFLSVDTDIIFYPSDLLALLAADKPICGSIYLTLDEQEEKVCAHLDEVSGDAGTYKDVSLERLVSPEGTPEPPFEISGLGMGFTLIKREVIQELSPIKALWPFAESDEEHGYGEDLTFCLRAKDKGFSSWIIPQTKVGHIKAIVI